VRSLFTGRPLDPNRNPLLAAAELPSGEWPALPAPGVPQRSQLREEVLSLLRHDAAQEPPLLTPSTPAPPAFSKTSLRPAACSGHIVWSARSGPRPAWPSSTSPRAPTANSRRRGRRQDHQARHGQPPPSSSACAASSASLPRLSTPPSPRLLDAGTTSDGRPWIAMDYIDGLPINRFCDERRLSAEERWPPDRQGLRRRRLRHRHLVVHRDLKPTNILVTADGTPKLLDFASPSC